MKILKKLSLFLLIITLVCGMLNLKAKTTDAAGIPIGALEIFLLPCTATYGSFWNVAGPAYELGVPSAGAYITTPISVIFGTHFWHPAGWVLGYYVTTYTCLMGVCPYCYTMPAKGTIVSPSGTN